MDFTGEVCQNTEVGSRFWKILTNDLSHQSAGNYAENRCVYRLIFLKFNCKDIILTSLLILKIESIVQMAK